MLVERCFKFALNIVCMDRLIFCFFFFLPSLMDLESDESQVVLLSDLQPKELAKDRVSEKKEEEEEEVALECSSLVVPSSDTDNEEQAQIEEETDEDAALEQVISQQLRSSPQDTFLDDKMLRFYSAINQFRLVAASADGTNLAATKARAIGEFAMLFKSFF